MLSFASDDGLSLVNSSTSGGGGDQPGNEPDINEVLYEFDQAGTFDFNVPVEGKYQLLACTGGAGSGYRYAFTPKYNGGGGASGCLLTAQLYMPAGDYQVEIPEGGKQGATGGERGEKGKDLVIYQSSAEYLHMESNSYGGTSVSDSAASGGGYSDATLTVAPEFITSSMAGNSGKGRLNGASNRYDGGYSPVGNAARSGEGGYGDDASSTVNSSNSRNGMPGYFKLVYLGND